MEEIIQILTDIRDDIRVIIEKLEGGVLSVSAEESEDDYNPNRLMQSDQSDIQTFMDLRLEDPRGLDIKTEAENKSDYYTLIQLYDEYSEFCLSDGKKPLGKRKFSDAIVRMYSPDPENISTIYSGYTRFPFIQAKPYVRKPISDVTCEKFISGLLESEYIRIDPESDKPPLLSNLYSEFLAYVGEYDLKTNVPSSSVFKMLIGDQFAPAGFSFTDIKVEIPFFYDQRAKDREEAEKNRVKTPIRRKLPSSPSKENTN